MYLKEKMMNLKCNEVHFKALFIILAFTFFYFSILQNPMFGDDFQRGIVKTKLLDYESQEISLLELGNIAIKQSRVEPVLYLEVSGEIYPLFFQAREGGGAYLPLRLLSTILDPVVAIQSYALILFLLSVFLSIRLFKVFGPDSFYKYTLVVSPFMIFNFGPYYADQLLYVLTLALVISLRSKQKYLPDLLMIAAFFVRVTFLWNLIFLFFVLPSYRKNYLRGGVYFAIYMLLAFLFTGTGNFSQEFILEYSSFKTLGAIQELLLKGVQLFFLENIYLQYFTRWEVSLWQKVIIYGFCILKMFVLVGIKPTKSFIWGMLAYFTCVFVTTYHFSSPADYLLYLYPYVQLLFIFALEKKQKWTRRAFIVLQILITMIFSMNYSKHGPIPPLDAKFNSKIALKLKDQGVKAVTLDDRFFWGQFDFFTNGELVSIYIDRMIIDRENTLDLCGYDWGEILFVKTDQASSKCKLEGVKGGAFKHPMRDAYIIYKE